MNSLGTKFYGDSSTQGFLKLTHLNAYWYVWIGEASPVRQANVSH
jgi:hypothetical protein